jgi:hypothetical protein
LKAARSAACAVLQDLFAAAVFATAFLTAVEVHFRRNLYTVRSDVPLGLPIQRDIDIASLLALLPARTIPTRTDRRRRLLPFDHQRRQRTATVLHSPSVDAERPPAEPGASR